MSTAVVTKPSLTIKRRFNAAPSKVFAAWTDPEKLKHWFGPGPVTCHRAEFDARVGGRYVLASTTPDGETHEVGGMVREIVPNEKISFTWAWKSTPERESLVTITLKPDGGGTIMTLTHEQFFDEEARDRHQHGWEGSLAKLETYLATQ
jgi:uncharacterized protein YndB with AHSA1/START domain